MLRILIAVAALYVFAGYTGHAKADEPHCSEIGKIIQSPSGGFEAFRIVTGDEVARAVAFYNSVPGDNLTFSPDSLVLVLLPSGNLRVVFAHNGLVCASMMIPQSRVPAVMGFIVGTKV